MGLEVGYVVIVQWVFPYARLFIQFLGRDDPNRLSLLHELCILDLMREVFPRVAALGAPSLLKNTLGCHWLFLIKLFAPLHVIDVAPFYDKIFGTIRIIFGLTIGGPFIGIATIKHFVLLKLLLLI